ncbi:NIPSNAP family protein [Mucilaginibacter sp. UR6-11]|uniref:NIPSNAP family protein n=1 Tax=Mucilaginibacter sp. UR6-11 TaxID=1435644 RepID=UPI001E28C282|nr:NIPSNAP family protein [Mucilaginibacter sp. UR6-11]MCC8425858.1 NIPSNAP family protein [Mucilaginibacter sp. UR6-11]
MKVLYKSCPVVLITLFVFATCLFSGLYAQAASPYYYQLKIYHYKTASQESRLDAYLQSAYLPALHRAGVKNVGVFKVLKQDSLDKKIYVYVPYRTWDALENTDQKILKDQTYLDAGRDYIDAPANDPAYTRIETIVLRAFPAAPEPGVPNLTAKKSDRIYELRSYESATEKFNASKVKMFNVGDEIGIFKGYNFNAIFYAEVIAGSHMPNLMYMTTFNSLQDNKDKWKLFFSDERFKALGKMAEYQKNVSKAESLFLYPADYSDY